MWWIIGLIALVVIVCWLGGIEGLLELVGGIADCIGDD